MYLQGDLQSVFDALYHMGVIDPVLEMDWSEVIDELPNHQEAFNEIVKVVNAHQSDVQALMVELEQFDDQLLGYLAMEVAKEFADFHSREDVH